MIFLWVRVFKVTGVNSWTAAEERSLSKTLHGSAGSASAPAFTPHSSSNTAVSTEPHAGGMEGGTRSPWCRDGAGILQQREKSRATMQSIKTALQFLWGMNASVWASRNDFPSSETTIPVLRQQSSGFYLTLFKFTLLLWNPDSQT